MAERVSMREISNEQGQELLRLVRRGSGSVVTWRRAQMVLLSAQGMDVAAIAKVSFTSPDRVRDVIHNFNADGFDALRPKYAGGRPPKFTLPQRTEIKKVALGRPADRGLPFSTWSLPKLADFLVAEGLGCSPSPCSSASRTSSVAPSAQCTSSTTRTVGVRWDSSRVTAE